MKKLIFLLTLSLIFSCTCIDKKPIKRKYETVDVQPYSELKPITAGTFNERRIYKITIDSISYIVICGNGSTAIVKHQ